MIGRVIPDRCFRLFPLNPSAKMSVVSAVASGLHLAVVSRSYEEYVLDIVEDLSKPRPERCDSTGMPEYQLPQGLAIIESRFSTTGKMQVLLGNQESSIVQVSSPTEIIDLCVGKSVLPACAIFTAISPNGLYVTLKKNRCVNSITITPYRLSLPSITSAPRF